MTARAERRAIYQRYQARERERRDAEIRAEFVRVVGRKRRVSVQRIEAWKYVVNGATESAAMLNAWVRFGLLVRDVQRGDHVEYLRGDC